MTGTDAINTLQHYYSKRRYTLCHLFCLDWTKISLPAFRVTWRTVPESPYSESCPRMGQEWHWGSLPESSQNPWDHLAHAGLTGNCHTSRSRSLSYVSKKSKIMFPMALLTGFPTPEPDMGPQEQEAISPPKESSSSVDGSSDASPRSSNLP